MSRYLTEEEVETIRNMRLDGYGPRLIAKKINRDPTTVKSWFKKLGLPTNLGDRPIDIIICKTCGKEYETQRRNTKFCSDRCRLKHNKKTILRTYRNCKTCEKSFKSYKSVYCSEFCRISSRYKNGFNQVKVVQKSRKLYLKRCVDCDKTLTATYKNRKICSDCRVKRVNELNERRKVRHNKKCKECSSFYLTPYNRSIFCNEKCGDKYWSRKKELKRRERISKNGRIDLDISIERLMIRDKKTCYLCGEKVVMSNNYNHELYPNIEHVMPIAKGGTHTWDNVKLAHRKCNMEKGIEVIKVI